MKCKYCGFNSEEEFISMIGAPCGFNGCTAILCCMDSYYDHVKSYHAGEVDREVEYKNEF